MTKRTGHVWVLIQDWLDSIKYPPSQNRLAETLGVSGSSLSDYKYATHMPPPYFVVLLSEEIGVPYEKVLDAVLHDHGYRGDRLAAVREELRIHGTPIAVQKRRAGRQVAAEREAIQERDRRLEQLGTEGDEESSA